MLESIGIVAFGLSGVLVARRRCLDLYGTFVLALVTALGGGVIRDLVLGIVPPANLVSPRLILLAAAPALLVAIPGVDALSRSPWIHRVLPLARTLLIADAIGLAAFTVSGVMIAEATIGGAGTTAPATLAVFAGVITATGGGMIRDLLAGVVPAVLRREIYAVASFLGAVAVVAAERLGATAPIGVGTGLSVTMLVRLGSHVLDIHLPAGAGCADRGDRVDR